MKHDFREDSVRVRFPEPSQKLSRRMDALFELEGQRCLYQKHRRKVFRPIAYATACAALFAVLAGFGWFWSEQIQQKHQSESTNGMDHPVAASVEYFAPEALVLVKSAKPVGALDFSNVITPNLNPERVHKRLVLNW